MKTTNSKNVPPLRKVTSKLPTKPLTADPLNYFVNAVPPESTVASSFAIRELPKREFDDLAVKLIRDHGPVKSNLETFNHWMTHTLIEQILLRTIPDEAGIFVFENPRILPPEYDGRPLFPFEARRRQISYLGRVIADVRRYSHAKAEVSHKKWLSGQSENSSEALTVADFEEPDDGELLYPDQLLFEIPLMVGSYACNLFGYTDAEKIAVYEDISDPFGYFIIKGSERIILNQDNLAFNHLISKERKSKNQETKITSHRISGTTELTARVSLDIGAVNIGVSQRGMRGTSSRPDIPVFLLFDAMFQLAFPDEYGYERVAVTPEERDQRRHLIMEAVFELLAIWILPEDQDRVLHFLAASRIIYEDIEFPLRSLRELRSQGTQISTVAKTAMASIARKTAADYAVLHDRYRALRSRVSESETENPSISNISPDSRALRKLADSVKSARLLAKRRTEENKIVGDSLVVPLISRGRMGGALASSIAASIPPLPQDQKFDYDEPIFTDFFADVFPGVQLSFKPVHLARLVAQQCLVSTGRREQDNIDSFANRRFKYPYDYISQQINAHVKFQPTATGQLHILHKEITKNLLDSMAMGGAKSIQENNIFNPRRETPIALMSQLSRNNTPVPRQIKNAGVREVNAYRDKVMCPSETPGGEACGLTQNECCMMKISLRRDYDKLGELVVEWGTSIYGELFNEYDPELRPHAIAVDTVIHGWVNAPDVFRSLRSSIKTNLEFYDVSVIQNDVDRLIEIYSTGTLPVFPMFTVIGSGVPAMDGTIPRDASGHSGLVYLSLDAATRERNDIWELIELGAIEYVSPKEQMCYRVCELPGMVEEALRYREVTQRNTFVEAAFGQPPTANGVPGIKKVVSRTVSKNKKGGAALTGQRDGTSSSGGPDNARGGTTSGLSGQRIWFDMYANIDPISILSYATAMMPAPETCQGPRVNYQASMIQQAINAYSSTYYNNDSSTFKQIFGSRPTYETLMGQCVGMTKAPAGKMFMICYGAVANNGEDGIVYNQRGVEDNHITKFHTHKEIITIPTPEMEADLAAGKMLKPDTEFERIERPQAADSSNAHTFRYASYRALDELGLPKLGQYIYKNMCYLGKTRYRVLPDGTLQTRDSSLFSSIGDEGVVDRISVVATAVDREDGVPERLVIRIRIRQTRGMFAGDKISSRYSQKGTLAAGRNNFHPVEARSNTDNVTQEELEQRFKFLSGVSGGASKSSAAGEIFFREGARGKSLREANAEMTGFRFARNLPRVASGRNKGMIPDLFIHPASMPSRMTIGMPQEMFSSKVSCYTGDRYDGTAFRFPDADEIEKRCDVLEENGQARDGTEEMIFPGESESLETRYFVAPCYYQILKHNVLDKIQFRSEGSIVKLTHQPVNGRGNQGGLRQGEMEKEIMISHGAAELVRERMMLASDVFLYEVCSNCGYGAATVHTKNVRDCYNCSADKANIVIVQIPYVYLLITGMVSGLGIQVSLGDFRPVHRFPDN